MRRFALALMFSALALTGARADEFLQGSSEPIKSLLEQRSPASCESVKTTPKWHATHKSLTRSSRVLPKTASRRSASRTQAAHSWAVELGLFVRS